ncbi:acyltransferase family protein [Alloyangia pacifica]|uniref:acyltransferase family protein n=1 Tax=Alloyangia pacifica TaxID=311180 RepID=UPI001CFEC94C|nr:acyltransferase [Alloyangia pacifica]
MHINSLDGYRFLAALIVLLGHFSNQTGIFAKTFGGGAEQIGVVMFFCLSGYFMGYKYFNSGFSLRELKIYLSRRLGRVMPLFLFSLFIGVLLSHLGNDLPFYKIDYLVALKSIALVESVSVMWSIVTECRFYFIFPFIWLGFFIDRRIGIFSIFLIVALGWSFRGHENELPKESLVQYLHIFGVGAALSLLCSRKNSCVKSKDFKINARTLNVLWLFSGFFILVTYPGISERFLNVYRSQSAYSDPYVLFACCLFLVLSIYSPLAHKILGCRFATFGGRVSFSIYLWHMPVIWASELVISEIPLEAQLILVGFVTLFVSWLSHKFIELPGQMLFQILVQTEMGNFSQKLRRER